MAKYRAVEEALKLADKQLVHLKAALALRPRLACASCAQAVHKDWAYCPYCGAQDRITVTPKKPTQ